MVSRANGSAVDLETAKTVAKIRKLVNVYGVAETATRVDRPQSYVSRVKNGQLHKKSFTALDELGLRFSLGLCRHCGKPCGIVCKSLRCIVCELRELAKEGVTVIQAE